MSDGNTIHTRSLRRRFLALLIDLALINLVVSVLVWPIANDLDSKFRFSGGLLNINACGDGAPKNAANQELKTDGWTAVVICDSRSNFLFPSRTATFVKREVNGNVTYTTTVAMGLNSNNQISNVHDLAYLFVLIFLIFSIVMEASAMRGTLGKRLLYLEVVSATGDKITFRQAFTRNLLKFFVMIAITIATIVSIYTLPNVEGFLQAGTSDVVAIPTNIFGNYFSLAIIGGAVLVIFQLVIHGSIFIPWSKAGRGLYDRWAKTNVIRV